MLSLVCKLCKLDLYITTYFGHGQSFIWEFWLLAFIENAKLKTAYSRNFSRSENDTILFCKLYMSSVSIKGLILKVLHNIYTDRFLLVAFARYVYHRSPAMVLGIVLFDFLRRLWKLLFSEQNILKILLYFCFFIQKAVTFIAKEWLVVESNGIRSDKLSMKNTFNVLSSGLQYTLSFKWTGFGLQCLVTITAKGQSLKLKASAGNVPISETSGNCNSLFKLVDSNWVVTVEQKRRSTVGYVLFAPVRVSAGLRGS